MQDLYRDRAPLMVTRQAHDPHATFADPLKQAVRPEPVRYPVL
jgi:hypothetical protein